MKTINLSSRFTGCLLLALAISSMASASTVLDTTDAVAVTDPTQQGRLSRNNFVGQDWGGDESFPGIVNSGVTYHYRTYLIPSASLQPNGVVQIILDDTGENQGNIFVSAYQNSYQPNSGGSPNLGFDTNWLGDNGFSGNFFGGTDTVSFQVLVPAGADLVVVVNNTGGGDVGTGEPYHLIVQSYSDAAFTSPPIFSTTSNLTREATGPNGAVVTFSPTATDADGNNASVVCTPASGSTFPLGVTPVQCTATGADASVSHSNFTVTVQDTTPPVITIPGNITVTVKGRVTSAVVNFTVSAHDLVDGTVTATATPHSGSTFPLGSTSVTVTAHDSHGNFAAKSFTVTVQKKKKKK